MLMIHPCDYIMQQKRQGRGLHALPSFLAHRLKKHLVIHSLCGGSGWVCKKPEMLTLKNFRLLNSNSLWHMIWGLCIMTNFWILFYLQVCLFFMNYKHLKSFYHLKQIDKEKKIVNITKCRNKYMTRLTVLFQEVLFPQVILSCPFYFLSF